MSSTHLLPNPLPSPKLKKTVSFVSTNAKKMNPWLNPFDDRADPQMEYLFDGGKQEEDPTLPDNPSNPYRFLKFPSGYNVELTSLASKVRGDVRRCCCVISVGVYDNLVFFFSGGAVDQRPVFGGSGGYLALARGKQCNEICKNVRWANVYDLDDEWPEPAEFTDMVGVLRDRYYDMILSTKLAGLGHSSSCRQHAKD